MSVKIDKQTIYMGAGLSQVGWVVWDDNVVMGWHMEYDAAHKRAHDLKEQKEHRDGV
jgi:hypothetical protein|tara:strand:+ start:1766 stop:1936 length:171 start_codon:yes stop_codon:yes gene_type:complete